MQPPIPRGARKGWVRTRDADPVMPISPAMNRKGPPFQTRYGLTSRGGKGVKTSQRTGLVELVRPEIPIIEWGTVGDA